MEKVYGSSVRQDGLYKVGHNKWELIYGFGKDNEQDENGWNWRHRFTGKPTIDEIAGVMLDNDIAMTSSDYESLSEGLKCDSTELRKRFALISTGRLAADSYKQMMEVVRLQQLKRTDISDSDALRVPSTFYQFQELCGKPVEAGVVLRYQEKLWRVVQAHTVSEIYPPSINTASLYSRIDKTHAGTIEDPIPYEQNMAFEKGKYYEQYGVLYLCLMTTQTGYPNDLKDLPTIVKPI